MNYSSRSVSPVIFAFDEDDDQIRGDVYQEGQQPRLRTVGKPPSQRELDEHRTTEIGAHAASVDVHIQITTRNN